MTKCPICKAEAKELDKVGLADGFDCPNHQRFRVSETVIASPELMRKPRQDWEEAEAWKSPGSA